jgi:hypothetical protein
MIHGNANRNYKAWEDRGRKCRLLGFIGERIYVLLTEDGELYDHRAFISHKLDQEHQKTIITTSKNH